MGNTQSLTSRTLASQMFAREVATRQLWMLGRPPTEHTNPSPTSTEPCRVGCDSLLRTSDHQQTIPSGEHPNKDTLEQHQRKTISFLFYEYSPTGALRPHLVQRSVYLLAQTFNQCQFGSDIHNVLSSNHPSPAELYNRH